MEIQKIRIRLSGAAMAITFAVISASTASAAPQTFSMLGEMIYAAANNNLPLPGAGVPLPAIQPFGGINVNGVNGNAYQIPYRGQNIVVGGCTDCLIQNTGVANPSMMIQTAAFAVDHPPANPGFRGFGIPGPTIQLTTNAAYSLPSAAVSLTGRTGTPAQAWCPGTGPNQGLACTTPVDGSAAGQPFASYTATGNQFGGAMTLIATAAGGPGTSFGSVGIPVLGTGPNGGPLGRFAELLGARTKAAGGVLANTVTNMVTRSPNVPYPLYSIASSNATGFVLALGSLIPETGAGVTGTTTAVGFPYTTGMIRLSKATGPAFGRVFVLTGSDTRGTDGSGMITLVGGGLTRQTAGTWSIETNSIRLVTFTPEPTTWLASGSALAALALGRLITGRRRRQQS